MAGSTTSPSPGDRDWWQHRPPPLNLPTHHDEGLDINHCLQEIRGGHNLHNNARDLVANTVALGSPEWLIMEGMTHILEPVSDGGTLAQLSGLIRSAKQKFLVHGNQRISQAPVIEVPLQATPIGLLDPKTIPRRRWILGRRLIRENVSLLIAPGGMSKSTLVMSEGIAIATLHFFGAGESRRRQCA